MSLRSGADVPVLVLRRRSSPGRARAVRGTAGRQLRLAAPGLPGGSPAARPDQHVQPRRMRPTTGGLRVVVSGRRRERRVRGLPARSRRPLWLGPPALPGRSAAAAAPSRPSSTAPATGRPVRAAAPAAARTGAGTGGHAELRSPSARRAAAHVARRRRLSAGRRSRARADRPRAIARRRHVHLLGPWRLLPRPLHEVFFEMNPGPGRWRRIQFGPTGNPGSAARQPTRPGDDWRPGAYRRPRLRRGRRAVGPRGKTAL
jgi:hypothetical protein